MLARERDAPRDAGMRWSRSHGDHFHQDRMTDTIHFTLAVPLPRSDAFALFAQRLAQWWPREYTWSQDVLEHIGIEPRLDGFCYERGPHGFRCDWGRVLAWEPPDRLTIAWQISPRREPEPDPARASTIELRFDTEGEGRTRVTLEHRDFDHHGDGAEGYRESLASEQGWPYILSRYAAAAG
jgi:uncharacterized protein YndB with AHSA1/START domain